MAPMRLPTVLLVLAGVLAAATPAGAAVRVQRGVVYGSARAGDGRVPLVLDLYRPARASRARRPVVVVIHGGGFRRGSGTTGGVARIARALASRGIVAASIDCRLAGQDPRPSARVRPLLAGLPDGRARRAVVAAVDDTLTAIGWLRAHARRLRIDV